MAESDQNPVLSNKLYDALKFFALVVLPAVGTLYFALAAIWGLPFAEKVIGSITAFDAFLGVVLHLSTGKYYSTGANFDGTMHVVESSDKTQFNLELKGDPADLPGKHSVEFNVNKVAPTSPTTT